MAAITKREVEAWTPEVNPTPSAELMAALADEFQNDYLTSAVWGEAHHMDELTAARFLLHCQGIRTSVRMGAAILTTNINPHA